MKLGWKRVPHGSSGSLMQKVNYNDTSRLLQELRYYNGHPRYLGDFSRKLGCKWVAHGPSGFLVQGWLPRYIGDFSRNLGCTLDILNTWVTSPGNLAVNVSPTILVGCWCKVDYYDTSRLLQELRVYIGRPRYPGDFCMILWRTLSSSMPGWLLKKLSLYIGLPRFLWVPGAKGRWPWYLGNFSSNLGCTLSFSIPGWLLQKLRLLIEPPRCIPGAKIGIQRYLGDFSRNLGCTLDILDTGVTSPGT